MTITDLIDATVALITDAALAPFWGFMIVAGAAGYLFRRLSRSAR